MDPQQQFCPNPDCPDHGVAGRGNIGVFSQKHHRYQCHTCARTFAATHGIPLYRRHHDQQLFG